MQRSEYNATLIVILGLSAATLTGFLRQAVIANQLGVGRATDIYLVAFALPEFIFVALPIVLAPAFIPLFIQSRQHGSEALAWRFVLRVAAALLLGLIAFSTLAYLGAPLYLSWLSPGFEQEEHLQAILAARLMLPGLLFMGLATLSGAVLQIYRRFAFPALSTGIYNLVFILSLLFFPSDHSLERAAWGVTLGAGFALLFQLPVVGKQFLSSLASKQPTIIQTADKLPLASMRELTRLAGPLAAGYGIHHLILFIDRAMATTLGEGSVATLNFSYHLALAIGQLSGLAVSTVIFPSLSEQMDRGDLEGARRSVSSSLLFVFMIAFPATVGLILLRVPVITILFEHGAFDQLATASVSVPLVWYSIAIFFDALCQPLWRVIYAQRSAWLVFGVNGMQTGLRFALNLILIGTFGYVGLAISAAIGIAIQAMLLGWLVNRKLAFHLDGAIGRYIARVNSRRQVP